MESKSNVVVDKIKEKLKDKFLFVSTDETMGSLGRPMCIVLVGPLDSTYLERPYLIDVVNLGATNNCTVQQCLNSSLFQLLGGDLDYDKVLLFLADGAAYFVKAGKGLKEMYPNLIHCLCLTHGLNRVAELVMYSFPKVDDLIAEVKKVFVKCAHCKLEFAASCQVPLPPEPIPIR